MSGSWKEKINRKKPLNIQGFQPADDGTRTRDLLTTNLKNRILSREV